MKLRKWTSLLLVMLLVISAAACGGKSGGEKNADTGNTEAGVSEKEPEKDSSPAVALSFPIENIDQFRTEIAKLVDLSLYDESVPEMSDGSGPAPDTLNLTLKEENENGCQWDYQIRLSDGTECQLNGSMSQLADAGWIYPDSRTPDQTIKAKTFAIGTWLTKTGEERLEVYPCNETEADIPWQECTFAGIEYNADDGSDVDFTFFGDLTKDSGIGDVVRKIGVPSGIDAALNNNMICVTYREYTAETQEDRQLEIDFDAGTGKIAEIQYTLR